MIVLNNKPVSFTVINDPIQYEKLPTDIRWQLTNGDFKFKIPEYIIENKKKKEYKAGFLNELYLLMMPFETKKKIFEIVSTNFDIFVDERQYQNMISEYQKNKYSVFIK